MIERLFAPFLKVVVWLSSPMNRARVRGARVEVIAYLFSYKPEPMILLGKSRIGEAWMPPQEGVHMRESLQEAWLRCLRAECGMELPDDEAQRERQIHLRTIFKLGTLDLPQERWGERLVADDCAGTVLESVQLRRKAYWAALSLVTSSSAISVQFEGNELVELVWLPLDEARARIEENNRPQKAELILQGIDRGVRYLGLERHVC